MPDEQMRIPPHPHAGFEVATYLLAGEFFHRDSAGHDQVATAGDLNWMTAGKGVLHSEGPTPAFMKKGGPLELVQVWINLPADRKTMEPGFRHYGNSVLPVITNGNAQVKVLIGEYGGKQSPVTTQTNMFYYHIILQPGDVLTVPAGEGQTAALYLMSGSQQVMGEKIGPRQLVEFENNGDHLALSALAPASFLVFGGTPIAEKTVKYGPFVMNSMEEIEEKITAYEAGQMGSLDH